MKRLVGLCLLAIVLLPAALLSSQEVTFELLGDLRGDVFHSEASDVSHDGSVVVGYGWADSWRPSAIRWEDGLMERIPGMGQAFAISGDGTVVTGHREWLDKYNHEERGIVLEAGNITVIDDPRFEGERFDPIDISSDGTRILGTVRNSSYIWENGALTNLGTSPAGGGLGVEAISGDGTVIVGAYTDTKPVNAVHTPFIIQDNVLSELPILPDHNEGLAMAVNYDGSIVVGRSYYRDPETGGGFGQPCRWENGELFELKDFDGQAAQGGAIDISEKGTILGTIESSENPGMEFVIWSRKTDWKPVSITQLLLDHGYDLYETYDYIELKKISADGTTIVGSVREHFPSGPKVEAFRIQIFDMFGRHQATAGYVDTAQWLGWLQVEYAPWVWCLATQCWFYISEDVAAMEGGWMYAPNMAALEAYPASGYAWSYKLSKWVYIDSGGSGWVYVL